ALLFLGSGSVIHALSGEQDLRKMGGLKGRVPVTFLTMFVATLAIAGIPGLSGFFSKDEILWKSFSSPLGGPVLWIVAAAAAGITAFYMFRLIFLAFFGPSRMDAEVEKHVHESPRTMTVPLSVLAVLSAAGGFLGIPAVLGGALGVPNVLERWLEPAGHGAAAAHGAGEAAHASAGLEIGLMALSVGIALCGIWYAHRLYRVRTKVPDAIANRWPTLYDAVRNKYYVDEFYEWAVVKRIVAGADWLWQIFDARFIDGIVNGLADLVRAAGGRVRRVQGGILGGYAFSLLAGAVLLVGYILFRSLAR
ncbi:MAG: proton-translocating NADH-quinone oxidoreductase, chain, partial [Deltaproteobacteria bacterium]|nr:proton-translocating NADH-quinone oxidoreductase, chain [Deltaproteobacteria bacterium]